MTIGAGRDPVAGRDSALSRSAAPRVGSRNAAAAAVDTALQDVILPHKDNGSYGQCRAHGGEKAILRRPWRRSLSRQFGVESWKRAEPVGYWPRTFLPTGVYGVVAGAATYAWPDACLFAGLRTPSSSCSSTAGRTPRTALRPGLSRLSRRVNEVIPLPRFWLMK